MIRVYQLLPIAALALLGGCALNPPQDDPTHEVAEQCNESEALGRDLQRKIEQLQLQLREERRKNQQMGTQLQDAKRNYDELKRKLDSLRDIDREMRARQKAR